MKFQTTLVALTITIAVLSCASLVAAQCSGAGFDLSSLSGKTITGSDSSFDYYLTPCGVCSQSSDCSNANAAMCAYIPPNYYTLNLAKWTSASSPAPVWTPISDGVSIAFTNADSRYNRTAQTTINVHCGPANAGTMTVTMDATNYIWTVDLTDSSACGGGSAGKLGGGWIFVIIVTCAPVLYMAIGCGVNMHREGTSLGMDSFPQKDMWGNFFGYVVIGFGVTKNFLLGLCNKGGSSSSSYEDIPGN